MNLKMNLALKASGLSTGTVISVIFGRTLRGKGAPTYILNPSSTVTKASEAPEAHGPGWECVGNINL